MLLTSRASNPYGNLDLLINKTIVNSNNKYSFDDVKKENPNRNRMGIQERFSQTDRALEEGPTWPNVSSIS